jgi:hypothetical protein
MSIETSRSRLKKTGVNKFCWTVPLSYVSCILKYALLHSVYSYYIYNIILCIVSSSKIYYSYSAIMHGTNLSEGIRNSAFSGKAHFIPRTLTFHTFSLPGFSYMLGLASRIQRRRPKIFKDIFSSTV